ncbi:hypothetical protein MYOV003v1_p0076 [Vibrio phage 207E48.1]|nr:hypothetical protein MYOV003v1_p0076 [Vibrio phage 207E48.1]
MTTKMLVTTVVETGKTIRTGPWKSSMLEKWLEHTHAECGCHYLSYEIVECTDEDLKRPSPEPS